MCDKYCSRQEFFFVSGVIELGSIGFKVWAACHLGREANPRIVCSVSRSFVFVQER